MKSERNIQTLPPILFKLREVEKEGIKRRKEKRKFIKQAIRPTVEITPYTTHPILLKCRRCGHTILSSNPIASIVRAKRHLKYSHSIELEIQRFTIEQLPKLLRIQREFALKIVDAKNVNQGVKSWGENFLKQLWELIQRADYNVILKSLREFYQIVELTITDYRIIKWCLTKNRRRTNYILQSNRKPQLISIIEERKTKRGKIIKRKLKTIVVASNVKLF